MSSVLEDHRRSCDGFTEVVRAASGAWSNPSPCADWDARGVLEHVIGFHDVLLLRPLEAKPARPRDDPEARWSVTVEALFEALARPGALTPERSSLLGYLTTDVVVHTWDLAAAIGAAVTLDERLCQLGLDRALANRAQFEASDMFADPVPVPEDASVQDRLLGLFGRDPGWKPPTRSAAATP